MVKPVISICVPTYNRKEKLKKLLNSIACKRDQKIEVVIVDDGSDDGTADFCSHLEHDYSLILIQQKNQGRSSALRNAIMNASGEFIVIMDSDDFFVGGAIDTIFSKLNEHQLLLSRQEICGLVFNCIDENKALIGVDFLAEGINNFTRYRAEEGIIGDKKEVVRRKLLQSVLYDLVDEERRMPTSIMWNRLSRNYDVITVKSALAVKEYTADGMSSMSSELRMQSPGSTFLYYHEHILDYRVTYRSRRYAFRIASNLIRYACHKRSFDIMSGLTLSQKAVVTISLPFGVALFFRDIMKKKV